MALALIERPGSSSNPYPLISENYELKLTQSIRSLLAEVREKGHLPTHFIEDFYGLMQARADPPLDSIWVYAALVFRSRETPKTEPLDEIAAAEDLFHLVSACSAPCGSSKSIALLAPVVCLVHKVVVHLCGGGKDLTLNKRDKKAMKKVKSLVEVILGYISVCCGKDFSDEEVGQKSITRFVDLVRLWMDSNVEFESFLPLVNSEVRTRLCAGECEVGYLAGVVIAEVFLLKLCLNFRFGGSREDLERDLRSWAVGSITGFCNFHFFEILLRMLLEKTLPLALILRCEDEILLRKVIYDAIILCEYPFVNPERAIHLNVDRMRSLDMTRLIVTHEAIEYLREHGGQRRSISYANAFSNSHLPTQIIEWFKKAETASKLSRSSPKALIKWLFDLEHQGVRVFDDSDLKYRAKSICDTSKTDFEQPAHELESEKLGDDLLFWVDNKREKEDTDEEDEKANESMNAAFIAASHNMKPMDKVGRKRKEETGAEMKKKIKLIDSNGSLPLVTSDDHSSSGSEVDNPLSDEDTE
ncbi:hypothetical protein FEM48_Zijuj08G0008000 [Ziziphus jujuba var. spinosa]|uniref:Uncharacterized protein n=1 Tax=Ziziphus jujuba var. spinosa TaxID=714518 RepID=A0A978UW11_ZIZJJ|nr:hypothetical protein FEM48_Zijuj08G0008000 [Ziziphus jujuba var. spinosa]